MKTAKPYDVIEVLNDEEDIKAYLTAVLESGASEKAIRQAFIDAERARAKLAQQEPNFGILDIILNAIRSTKNRTLAMT